MGEFSIQVANYKRWLALSFVCQVALVIYLLEASYRLLQGNYQFMILCYEDGDRKFDPVFASSKVDATINSWPITTYLILKSSSRVCAKAGPNARYSLACSGRNWLGSTRLVTKTSRDEQQFWLMKNNERAELARNPNEPSETSQMSPVKPAKRANMDYEL